MSFVLKYYATMLYNVNANESFQTSKKKIRLLHFIPNLLKSYESFVRRKKNNN